MAADASQMTPDDRARAYRARLKDEPLPSVILDCATAEVLAANAGGLSALGLTPANRLPAALDSAMPAIAALREITTRGLAGTTQKALMFWKNGRAASWPCSISAADASAKSHVVIVFRTPSEGQSEGSAIATTNGASVVLDAVAANDDAPPRVVRDDQDTLKEIARRIREGQRSATASSDAPPAKKADTVSGLPASAPVPVPVMASPEPSAAPLPQSAPPPAAVQPPPTVAEPPAAVVQPAPEPKATLLEPPKTPPAPSQTRYGSLPASEIAKLAHELKTPLTAISAAAEIMRDERLGAMGNAKYLGYAADIHASATHALAVISEMLAAGTGDHNRADQITGFDLTELAASTMSSMQPLAAQRGLTLSLDAETGLTPIRANPTAIRQILSNLLTNALKFTPPGGDVRVVTGYLNDGAVYMVVRDTGEGMDDEALMQAFNDAPGLTSVRTGGGRGIGLKLVRRLAAENGAEFEIDSAPGMGTVVLLAFAKDLAGPRSTDDPQRGF